jgi:hypothetical protein
VAESIPLRIGYYNAWSLPTQKYQIKSRETFTPQRKQSEESQLVESRLEERESVDKFLKGVEARNSKGVDTPRVEF